MKEEKDCTSKFSNTQSPSPKDNQNIEDLLQQRREIDQELKEKFTKNVTILFTDIIGSTDYFDAYGDIEGRLMVQNHNELLFPVIEKFQGRIVKTIGDAIMAAFKNPIMGVRAAIEMQRSLYCFNRSSQSDRQIHIRIGINTGQCIVEEHDIFGDVVNVAARIESIACADQILISASVYEQVQKEDDILCRFFNPAKVKRKDGNIDLYRVVWREEDRPATGQTRSGARMPQGRKLHLERLEIDITKDAVDTLKITVIERTERQSGTLRPYEQRHLAMPRVEEQCSSILTLLNTANTRGYVSKDILLKLKDSGHVLFNKLLTTGARMILSRTQIRELVCHIDDSLIQIPWELLFDGSQFLCQKFSMGRIVKTRHHVDAAAMRIPYRPLKLLIISDPRGDLKNSFAEGRRIKEEMDSHPRLITASHESGQVTAAYLLETIKNYDLVHFAGHADYDSNNPSQSGWLLDRGKFTCADIMNFAGNRAMPLLVFSNACQSGQTDAWTAGEHYGKGTYGLASAFLLSGVQHYVGTFWDVLDQPSAKFAVQFYRSMLKGIPIGEAIRRARLFLIKEYGEDAIMWAGYMLYGDPGVTYFDHVEAEDEPAIQMSSGSKKAQFIQAPYQIRPLSADTPSTGHDRVPSGKAIKALLWGGGLLGLVIFILLLWQLGTKKYSKNNYYLGAYALLYAQQLEKAMQGFESLAEDDPKRYEGLAAVYFKRGDYEMATEMCNKALSMESNNAFAHVIKGNLFFKQGRLPEAEKEYNRAANITGAIPWQRAEAFNGLGRVYALWGNTDKSLTCYKKAVSFNPERAAIYTNYGRVLQQSGNINSARAFYKKAAQINPGDPVTLSLIADIERRKKIIEDAETQKRIDNLIAELVENYRKVPSSQAVKKDTWTSGPLSLTLLPIEHRGIPFLREGEDEFFLMKVTSLLQQSGRVHIVERIMLDKILQELRLSTTDLADPGNALRIGKILSAKLIAAGRLINFGKDIQASFRITETETTVLKAAIIETGDNLGNIAEKTARAVIQKIKQAYPIRGKITAVKGTQVTLNIGSEQGLRTGMLCNILPDTTLSTALSSSDHGTATGSIKITSTSNNTAYATIVEKPKTLRRGMRIEQIIN